MTGRFLVIRADELRSKDLVNDPTGSVWHVDHVVVSDSDCVQINLREMRQVSPEARLVVWRTCRDGEEER